MMTFRIRPLSRALRGAGLPAGETLAIAIGPLQGRKQGIKF